MNLYELNLLLDEFVLNSCRCVFQFCVLRVIYEVGCLVFGFCLGIAGLVLVVFGIFVATEVVNFVLNFVLCLGLL